jgi:hypothetical protein
VLIEILVFRLELSALRERELLKDFAAGPMHGFGNTLPTGTWSAEWMLGVRT